MVVKRGGKEYRVMPETRGNHVSQENLVLTFFRHVPKAFMVSVRLKHSQSQRQTVAFKGIHSAILFAAFTATLPTLSRPNSVRAGNPPATVPAGSSHLSSAETCVYVCITCDIHHGSKTPQDHFT